MVIADELLIKISADLKSLRSSLRKAQKDLARFSKTTEKDGKKASKSLLNIGTIVSTSLGFGFSQIMSSATRAIKDFAVDSVASFIKAEQAMLSFQLVVGDTANVLLKDLNKAAKGTVSNLNLISAANKALALGINRSQLPELLETARARAKIMGITTTQAFDDIATGIGRQSRLILDNLGIILNMPEAYSQYANSIGKTVSQLNEFEKKTAISNAIIEETKGLVLATRVLQDTHTDSIQRLGAGYDNLKVKVGDAVVGIFDLITAQEDAFDKAGSRKLVNNLASDVVNLSNDLRGLKQEAETVKQSFEKGFTGIFVGELAKKKEIADTEQVIKTNELLKRQREDELAILQEKDSLTLNESARALELSDLIDNNIKQLENQTSTVEILKLEEDALFSARRSSLDAGIKQQGVLEGALKETNKTNNEITIDFVRAWDSVNDAIGKTEKRLDRVLRLLRLEDIKATQQQFEREKITGTVLPPGAVETQANLQDLFSGGIPVDVTVKLDISIDEEGNFNFGNSTGGTIIRDGATN